MRIFFTLLAAAAMPCAAEQTPNEPIDFARHVRPILSDKCFLCHGPDENSREADLRLDLRDSALEDRGGYAAVVPGGAEESELVARITSDDPSMAMPPPDAKKQLTAEEIALLRRWVEEGAKYTEHWAFVAPERPIVPKLDEAGARWVRNPIDAFIYQRLQSERLQPSEEADKTTLLRRLHLDLTGLPPSVEQIDRFLANDSPRAYADLVEELLASPHYGERWARHWLDAARYADSDGYEKDMPRTSWFWRDWVIDALNDDKRYDDFIIEQIAGDMLPDAGADELIATGFLRNSMVNEEGGVDPEQFRVEGIFDRMDAIGKAILGVTTQCAQCHTHKYDPLTHADYYGMFAFLNNCEEANTIAYSDDERLQRDQALAGIAEIEDRLKRETPDWRTRIRAWVDQVRGNQPQWRQLRPMAVPFDGQKFRVLDDNSILSEGYAPPTTAPPFEFEFDATDVTGIRLEALMHPQLPGGGPGRSVRGAAALSELSATVEPLDGRDPGKELQFVSATADVNVPKQSLAESFPEFELDDADERVVGPVEFAVDGNDKTAWTTDSGPATRHQSRKAVFVAKKPFGYSAGTKLTITLKQDHGGKNGNKRQNYLLGRYRVSITTNAAPAADPLPAAIRELVEHVSVDDWTDADFARTFSYWRTTIDDWTDANHRVRELERRIPAGNSQLVVKERQTPRSTHRFERGDFLRTAEEIEPHVPEFMHPLPTDAPRNRLGFARWLVDRDSPTTARTIVNRVWQAYFGIGLVETPEDLGLQSPAPSHPKLLDWLAVEFMDSGWSFKHLHRLIVNSAVYRQSSTVDANLAEVDPRNRLLARGARVRVDAEAVRDLALAASGLLNRQIGGPSVYPPAPRFLFMPPASYGEKDWFTEEDDQQYRRSLYVQTYRSVPYPPMQAFDAPRGDAACVRRTRSNTPLQALTLLNEPQFVDCSRAMARRVIAEAEASDQARLQYAFRLATTRSPSPQEVDVLEALLNKTTRRFQESPASAWAAIDVTDDEKSEIRETNVEQLAAWMVVCRAVLNLDETITKQ